MYGYIVRRLLWMVPTALAILVINFGVIRLRAPTLGQQMAQAAQQGGEGGELDIETQTKAVENYLVQFRRAGFDKPAVINLRGFADKADAVEVLRRIDRSTGEEIEDSERNELRNDLWLKGHFYLEPLVEILEDPELEKFHAPAAEAFVYNALHPLSIWEVRNLPVDVQTRIQSRNQELRNLKVEYLNTEDEGFVTADPDAGEKREELLDLYRENESNWSQGARSAWAAILFDTGFTDLVGKLFTGRLESNTRNETVYQVIGRRWQVTFWLNLIATLLAWGISIPIGIRSARRAGSLEDEVTTQSLFMLWSLPPFFVGSLFIYHLCTDSAGGAALFPHRSLSSQDSLWMTTPAYVLDLLWHAFLPLVVLTYASFTALSRYMRGNLLDQFGSDYARTARAKGCGDNRVVYHHALRNSMITMITLGSTLLGELFAGAIIVEKIWSIQGLGTLMLDAAKNNDAPVLMTATLIQVLLLLVSILIADLFYAVVDPRIRNKYA